MKTFVIFTAFLFLDTSSSSEWRYGDESHWPGKCQTGKAQSPVNLEDDASVKTSFEKFSFSHYDEKFPATLKNNGHSVQLTLDVPAASRPKVKGGGLPKEYILDHLHFHWGSEHTLNNHRFPLEVHLVHYAADYQNLKNALEYADGVAVLGALYNYSPDDDDEFQPIVSVIDSVENSPNSITATSKTKINGFLPRDTAGFFRYNGSLTTPNCTEAVIWTVFTNTIPVSTQQVKHFQTVHSFDGVLKENYRSLQDLRGRTVYQKVSPIPYSSADNNHFAELTFILSLAFLLM